jgi:hypothetical protein
MVAERRGEPEEVAGGDKPKAPACRDLPGQERHGGETKSREEEDKDQVEFSHG